MENTDRFCLLDGGLATELVNNYGHADINGDPLWSARIIISNPDDIAGVHNSFLEVGCDIIETATYQASLKGLCRHLSVDASKACNIIDEGVKICLRARDYYWEKVKSKGGRKPLVAGSIGPYGAHLANGSEYNGQYVDELSVQELVDWHRPQVERIWQSGVDILAFETIPAQKEAEAIIAVLREVPDAKAWLSFSCQNDKQTCHGESFADAVKTLAASDQITGCGVNCSAPWHVSSLLDSVPPIIKETKCILAYPNSGQVWSDNRWTDVDGNHSRPLDSYVDEWIERGASWIGGCCQVTAKELEFVRKTIDKHISKSKQ